MKVVLVNSNMSPVSSMTIVFRLVMTYLGGDENSTIPIFVTEKQILKPNDVSVFSALSINGRLFACPRDQLSSLVRDFPLFLELLKFL